MRARSRPGRFFTPLENGSLAGTAIARDDFEHALTGLYLLKGWDPTTGAPTNERLRTLGLEWTTNPTPGRVPNAGGGMAADPDR